MVKEEKLFEASAQTSAMSEKFDSSEKPAGSHIPKPSGIKAPTASKSHRTCCEKKPELPTEATPSKSE